jgi:hypothetical protein
MKKAFLILLVCLVASMAFAQSAVEVNVKDIDKMSIQDIKALLDQATAQAAAAKEAQALESARTYLKELFDTSTKSNPETRTPSDYTVTDIVTIKGVEYPVSWSADTEYVTIVPGENHVVTVKVATDAPAETHYILKAVVTNPNTGDSLELEIKHILPQGQSDPSMEEIVLNAYKLADGESMSKAVTLTGVITAIPTAYSEQYSNITVNIQIGGMTDNIIQCYRLSGDGCATLAVGDEITVTGTIKNYKGTIEFNKPTLVGMGYIPDQSLVVDAAYALATGESLKETQVLVGVITAIPTAYSEQYGNITVDMIPVGDTRTVQCYRLTGDGVESLAIGDTIVVQGTIKNYKGTVEFDKNCVLLKDAKAFNYLKTLKAAYALETGASLEGTRTLSGVITSIPTAYSEQYGNITVNIVVNGLEDMVVQCYRLTGDGVANLAVGDTITVAGTIKNYKGTVEFDKNCTIL